MFCIRFLPTCIIFFGHQPIDFVLYVHIIPKVTFFAGLEGTRTLFENRIYMVDWLLVSLAQQLAQSRIATHPRRTGSRVRSGNTTYIGCRIKIET
jgi:hypothetical protein